MGNKGFIYFFTYCLQSRYQHVSGCGRKEKNQIYIRCRYYDDIPTIKYYSLSLVGDDRYCCCCHKPLSLHENRERKSRRRQIGTNTNSRWRILYTHARRFIWILQCSNQMKIDYRYSGRNPKLRENESNLSRTKRTITKIIIISRVKIVISRETDTATTVVATAVWPTSACQTIFVFPKRENATCTRTANARDWHAWGSSSARWQNPRKSKRTHINTQGHTHTHRLGAYKTLCDNINILLLFSYIILC